MNATNSHRKYELEDVAQFIEWINQDINRNPERHRQLTPADRAMWAGFPAQVRAHRYPFVVLDPNRPISDYLKSGFLGPDFKPSHNTQE